jgi:hypothetical protein
MTVILAQTQDGLSKTKNLDPIFCALILPFFQMDKPTKEVEYQSGVHYQKRRRNDPYLHV